jgi:hypothetical protein
MQDAHNRGEFLRIPWDHHEIRRERLVTETVGVIASQLGR